MGIWRGAGGRGRRAGGAGQGAEKKEGLENNSPSCDVQLILVFDEFLCYGSCR